MFQFTWLKNLFGAMLAFFESITGGYAFALVLYAFVFKIIFLPFSIKQQKNQIAMAKLSPKIALIRAKYKGRTDQRTMQKQQQEIMELQQSEGYNPLSGCLPLLIQLPIILLLFSVITHPLSFIAKTTDAFDKDDKEKIVISVYNEVTLHSNEIDELSDLSKNPEIDIINAIYAFVDNDVKVDGKKVDLSQYPGYTTKEERIAIIETLGLDYDTVPNFKLWGVNLAEQPKLTNLSILCIIPFLAAAAQWVSMYLTRKFNGNPMMQQAQDAQAQASMKMMDLMFPALTLFMAFGFSGMLGLYWTFQALLGLLQSFILAKAMPLPKYTEEEIKEMHKAQKKIEKEQREIAKSQPKYRSLHYIDDDDYDVLPDAPTSEASKEKHIDGNMPDIKD